MTAMQLNKAAYRACANANNSRTIGCTHKVKAGQAAGAVPGVACSESRSAHALGYVEQPTKGAASFLLANLKDSWPPQLGHTRSYTAQGVVGCSMRRSATGHHTRQTTA
jgi:hypothetical protein